MVPPTRIERATRGLGKRLKLLLQPAQDHSGQVCKDLGQALILAGGGVNGLESGALEHKMRTIDRW